MKKGLNTVTTFLSAAAILVMSIVNEGDAATFTASNEKASDLIELTTDGVNSVVAEMEKESDGGEGNNDQVTEGKDFDDLKNEIREDAMNKNVNISSIERKFKTGVLDIGWAQNIRNATSDKTKYIEDFILFLGDLSKSPDIKDKNKTRLSELADKYEKNSAEADTPKEDRKRGKWRRSNGEDLALESDSLKARIAELRKSTGANLRNANSEIQKLEEELAAAEERERQAQIDAALAEERAEMAEERVKQKEILAEANALRLKASQAKNWWMVGALTLLIGVIGLGVVNRKKIKNLLSQIESSINYASRLVGNRLGRSREALSQFMGTKNAFVLLNAKDVLSGDFYFSRVISENLLLSVAGDCTGHGVPGSLLSVLMQSWLDDLVDEIISENKGDEDAIRKKLEEDDGQYLANKVEDMRQSAIRFLSSAEGNPSQALVPMIQNGKLITEALNINTTVEKNGAEMAITIVDKQQGTGQKAITFLGANQSVCIVSSDGEFEEIKGTRKGINKVHPRIEDKKYQVTKIVLNEGDMIYTFSDGYPDQIGGEKGGKFLKKNLKELFAEIHKLPVEEQVKVLQRTLLEWKGDRSQVDDVLIVGLRG